MFSVSIEYNLKNIITDLENKKQQLLAASFREKVEIASQLTCQLDEWERRTNQLKFNAAITNASFFRFVQSMISVEKMIKDLRRTYTLILKEEKIRELCQLSTLIKTFHHQVFVLGRPLSFECVLSTHHQVVGLLKQQNKSNGMIDSLKRLIEHLKPNALKDDPINEEPEARIFNENGENTTIISSKDLFSLLPSEIAEEILLYVNEPKTTFLVSHYWASLTDIVYKKIYMKQRACSDVEAFDSFIKMIQKTNAQWVTYRHFLMGLRLWLEGFPKLARAVLNSSEEGESLSLSCKLWRQLKEGDYFSKSIFRLQSSEIEKIAAEISLFSRIETLHISQFPKLIKITEHICQLNQLKILKIQDCPHLTEIKGLQRIETLRILVFKNLPQLIFKRSLLNLPQIKELFLERLTIPPSIRLDLMSKLHSLSVIDCQIEEFPAKLFLLSQLAGLTLAKNPFKEIPLDLLSLRSLRLLDVSHTPLRALPNEMGLLGKLRILSIMDTNIRELPSSLTELEPLQINMNIALIEKLPEGFFFSKSQQPLAQSFLREILNKKEPTQALKLYRMLPECVRLLIEKDRPLESPLGALHSYINQKD